MDVCCTPAGLQTPVDLYSLGSCWHLWHPGKGKGTAAQGMSWPLTHSHGVLYYELGMARTEARPYLGEGTQKGGFSEGCTLERSLTQSQGSLKMSDNA
jgi:hypothetical protein